MMKMPSLLLLLTLIFIFRLSEPDTAQAVAELSFAARRKRTTSQNNHTLALLTEK
jgi:hypothetical protein